MKFIAYAFVFACSLNLVANATEVSTAEIKGSVSCESTLCSTAATLAKHLIPYIGVIAFYTYIFNDKKEATKDGSWFNTYITPTVQNEITKALLLSIFVDLIKQDSKEIKAFFVNAVA